MAKILSADKIVLLSHQDLHLRATIDEMKMGSSGHWRSIRDSTGQVNDCIVVERLELKRVQLDILKRMLSKKYISNIPSDKASCFNPHQAIVLFHSGKCSFVDICFDCRQFSSSGDILFPSDFLSTDEQWDSLRNFFISVGIKYKIELKRN